MATLETLIDQLTKSDLDILALLKLRGSIDRKIAAVRDGLRRQLEQVEGALADASADSEGSGGGSRRGRPAGGKAKPRKKAARRTGKRGSAAIAGKHAGLSVADAVKKIFEAKGGKLATADLKKSFVAAGDKRNLNFTILVRQGLLKRVGFEARKEGKKGRAGGIYTLA
jgi:hypothetical protein